MAFDLSLVNELLQMPSKQPDYRQGRSHKDFVTNLKLTTKAVKAVLRKSWDASGDFSDGLRDEVAKLVEQKYSKPEWNLKF